MTNEGQFRPQAEAKASWRLLDDWLQGLKVTAENSQPLMALKYVQRGFEDFLRRFEQLEAQVVDLVKKVESEAASKSANKSRVASKSEDGDQAP